MVSKTVVLPNGTDKWKGISSSAVLSQFLEAQKCEVCVPLAHHITCAHDFVAPGHRYDAVVADFCQHWDVKEAEDEIGLAMRLLFERKFLGRASVLIVTLAWRTGKGTAFRHAMRMEADVELSRLAMNNGYCLRVHTADVEGVDWCAKGQTVTLYCKVVMNHADAFTEKERELAIPEAWYGMFPDPIVRQAQSESDDKRLASYQASLKSRMSVTSATMPSSGKARKKRRKKLWG
jgi:hypothetical protein